MRQHFQNHSLPDTKHKAWFPRLGLKIVNQSYVAYPRSFNSSVPLCYYKIYILRVLIEVEGTAILTQYLAGWSFQTLFFLPQANDVRWQHLIELSHFSHLENSFLYLIVTSVKFRFLKIIQLIRHQLEIYVLKQIRNRSVAGFADWMIR